MSSIFRKSAVDKLSSPEQLDKMIQITSPMFWIAAIGGGLILAAALVWSIVARLPVNIMSEGIYLGAGGVGNVYATGEGIVDEVFVSEGDTIEKGQVIASYVIHDDSQDDETEQTGEIISTLGGTVIEMTVYEGSLIYVGNIVCRVARMTSVDNDLVICYVPATLGRKVQAGMKVQVYPSTVNRQEYGHICANVVSVDSYVTSYEEIENTLADTSLVDAFTSGGPVICVRCELKKDPSTVSGYKWSSSKGSSVVLDPGTMVSADIVTEEKAPITMLIPLLKEKMSLQNETVFDE